MLKLYLWADKFLFFPRLDLNSHQWYTAAPIAKPYVHRPRPSGHIRYMKYNFNIYIYITDVANWSRMLDISISDWRELKSRWERTKKMPAQKSNSNTIELNISHYIYSERYSHKQDIKYTMIQIYCLLSIYGNIIIGNTYIKTVVYLWCMYNVNISRQYMM